MEKNNNLMSGKGEKGEWITVNGSHIFIEDGQSVEDAMQKHFNKSTKNPDIEKLAQKTGFSYRDAERMYREMQEEDEAYKNFLNNKTEENRNDKYTIGNPDNINKQTTPSNISTDLANYKGSGQVDLVMPGGKWAQIRPQKDDSYLVRSSNGNKYVATVEDAKNELIKSFSSSISPDKAEAFAKGKGHLSENGGYQGVSNINNAPTFEYNTQVQNLSKEAEQWADTTLKDAVKKTPTENLQKIIGYWEEIYKVQNDAYSKKMLDIYGGELATRK